MADGKWIEGLDAEMPLAQAARHVLAVRLGIISRRLPPALEEVDGDPEHVHQLRVATRRAAAALRIFADCLPERTLKQTRKRLRRLRRAAGLVRDWDVFLIDLLARRPRSREQPGIDYLAGYAFGQRSLAHEGLVTEGEAQLPDLAPFLTQAIESVQPPSPRDSSGTLLNHGRSLLGCLLAELDKQAAGDLSDYTQLHQVRIAGKRLRYAMEVFAPCFPPFFVDELYAQVEQMQDILGTAHDHHVAAEQLGALQQRLSKVQPRGVRRWQAGIEAVLKMHNSRLPHERRRFLRFWKSWDSSATRQRWSLLVGTMAVP